MVKLPEATPADAKAVWEAMIAEGEEPSLQKCATRLGAKFRQPNKNTIKRWKDRGWSVQPHSNPPPIQQSESNINDAVAGAQGDPTATGRKLAASPLVDDCRDKPLPELMNIAAREQMLVLIATARFTRNLIALGTTKTETDEESGKETKTVEPADPTKVGGLVSALAGSFSTTTSVADKAFELGLKDVTPPKDGKIIEGEVQPPEDELAEVMRKAAEIGHGSE